MNARGLALLFWSRWIVSCSALVSPRSSVSGAGVVPTTQGVDGPPDFDGDVRIIEEPRGRAYPQQTPHSGRHFLPSHPAYRRPWWRNLLSTSKRRRRFTEGWYYRLTLDDVSFAFIISIEDPGLNPPSNIRLACIQVVGPHDQYLVQGSRDDTLFWAWKKQQGLGCTFSYRPGVDEEELKQKTALHKEDWHRTVESGFQMLPTCLLGRVRGRDGTVGDILDDEGEPMSCDFDITIDPICGWGGTTAKEQKSTAGWLASFPVFEPHWQITLADARASGRVTWNNRTYDFTDAPMYAEKNWGSAALPSKWYWTQCNSFPGHARLSVVAGGGIRKIPFGKEEILGMVCCHYNGTLYECVPWLGGMEWQVAPWGMWKLRGNNTFCERPFEIEVTYTCDPERTPGLVFRAPTEKEGLVRFCRDTFEADAELSLWELEWDDTSKRYIRKAGPPLVDRARSGQGGAEVGGGPWWDVWKREALVKKPIKALLRLPYRFQRIRRNLQKKLSR
jgi:tocopherol cyclase